MGPQTMTRDKFSRKQTLDLQTAMALALARFVKNQTFPGPGGKGLIRFQKVFEEWPTQLDANLSPAACVVSTETLHYAEAFPTPKLLEDTWEPRGGLGLGLYEVSEGECDFHLEVRASTKKERSAVVAAIEAMFFEEGVLNNHQKGSRYGVLVPLPEYWSLQARFAIQDKMLADEPEAAKVNRWEATFVVRAQAPHVRLDTVAPFLVKVVETYT